MQEWAPIHLVETTSELLLVVLCPKMAEAIYVVRGLLVHVQLAYT